MTRLGVNHFEFNVLNPIDKKVLMFTNSFILLISDIICANPDSHDFQMKQRTQKYNDLKHAVQILRYVREDSPIGNVFLKMYLLESGQIKFEQYKVIKDYHSLMQLVALGILHCKLCVCGCVSIIMCIYCVHILCILRNVLKS